MIRAQRATEIQNAVEAHQANGGRVLFVTLTARHSREDLLSTTLDGVLTSWQEILRSRQWREYRERLGMVGYIRSVEVTYGENGWHPHIHALLLVDADPSEQALARWGAWMRGRWADLMETKTGRRPDDVSDVGVNIKRAQGSDIAGYIAKVQETDRVGQEMARADFKLGRRDSLMPFELLDDPNSTMEALWEDYYRSTKGRRAITWSHGLKDTLGIEEVDDQEIVDDTEEIAEEIARVDAVTWDRIVQDHERLSAMLEAAEVGDVARIEALARAFRLGELLLDESTGELLDPRFSDPRRALAA